MAAILFLAIFPLRADDFSTVPRFAPMHFVSKIDAQTPLELTFQNESGESVELGHLLNNKPVILNLVYFNCPRMCTDVLNGLVSAMRRMRLELGKDYSVITLSIDDREKPDLAKAKKRLYVDHYGRPGAESGWSFLTGKAEDIQSLAEAVGFNYHYYPDIDQYDHALGIVVLTPKGKIAQYFYGVRYDPGKLSAALVKASKGSN